MSRHDGLLLDDGRPPPNSFVVRDKKIVYVSVTKAACTSLRWMVADLAGEDPQSFRKDIFGPFSTRLQTIHTPRRNWQQSPQLTTLTPEELTEISPHDGWFVFAVVRDPWTRLWSAWQSKLLVQHPVYVRLYRDEPWFPRVPETADDVVEDFRRFVETHPWTSHPDLAKDRHFWTVTRSVRPDRVNYTRVYDLSRMSELIGDLGDHLAAQGHDTDLYLPRANETPLRLTREVLDGGVAERIAELYAVDIATFGQEWGVDRLSLGESWTPDALRSVRTQVHTYERVIDYSEWARQKVVELREARAEIARLQRLVDRASARPPLERVPTTELARTVLRRVPGAVRRRVRRTG